MSVCLHAPQTGGRRRGAGGPWGRVGSRWCPDKPPHILSGEALAVAWSGFRPRPFPERWGAPRLASGAVGAGTLEPRAPCRCLHPASGRQGLGHLLRTMAFLGLGGIPGSAGSPHSAQQGQLVCLHTPAWGRGQLGKICPGGQADDRAWAALHRRVAGAAQDTQLWVEAACPEGPGGTLID